LKKVYLLGTGKRRYAKYLYDFTPHRFSVYLTKAQWKEIISWFLLEQDSQTISNRTSLERGRVLRALTIIRQVLIKDIPDIFSGSVEVDETYPGGQWRNKRKAIRDNGTKRGRETKKQQYSGSSVGMELFGQK